MLGFIFQHHGLHMAYGYTMVILWLYMVILFYCYYLWSIDVLNMVIRHGFVKWTWRADENLAPPPGSREGHGGRTSQF